MRQRDSLGLELVTGSTCKILELKPDNADAKAMGKKQSTAYRNGLINWFTANKDDLLKQFPDVGKCVSDGKLVTDDDVETYKFCPDDSEARAFGEDLSGLSSDLSESD